MTIRIFISYAHDDAADLAELRPHLDALNRKPGFEVWFDGALVPGQDWNEEIMDRLERADVFVLLLSPAFYASAYIGRTELLRAWARRAEGTARIVPVLVEDCRWQRERERALELLPKIEGQARAVRGFERRDSAWDLVVEGIERVAADLVRERAEAEAAKKAAREATRRRWVGGALLAALVGLGAYAITRPRSPADFIRVEPVDDVGAPFDIQRTEVTQGQWAEVMNGAPAYFSACGDACPVERVSWYDALVYLNRRSEQEGKSACYRLDDCTGTPGGGCDRLDKSCDGDFRCARVVLTGPSCEGYRLPTPAEWQRAAGADFGANLEIRGENDAPALGRLAWYGGNSAVDYIGAAPCDHRRDTEMPNLRTCGTNPVGLKMPNPLGLVDVLGNVWELTHADASADVEDYGGGWASPAARVSVVASSTVSRTLRSSDLGFRPAITPR